MGMNNRLQNGQRLRNSFACVVDGETEIWYLNILKRNEPSMKSISIRPELPQKKTLEEQFKQGQTLAESYTAVFWIIDTDTIISNERTFAGDRNKSPRVVLKKCVSALPDNAIFIANTPCFEFWVLLHVLKTSTGIMKPGPMSLSNFINLICLKTILKPGSILLRKAMIYTNG